MNTFPLYENFTLLRRYYITEFAFLHNDNLMKNNAKICRNRRDFFLIFILILSVLVVLQSGKLQKLVAATDRPCLIYEDFWHYYLPAAKTILNNPQPIGGYFYTPTFALFLNLLLQQSIITPMLLWQIFQYFWLILLILIPGFFFVRLSGNKSFFFLYLLACASSFSVFHNLKWGQVSIMITFLSLASLILYRHHLFWSALLLAVATLVKYYPGFLIIGFLFKRDWKFISLYALFVLILGLILPGVVLGFAKTAAFYQQLFVELDYALDWVAQDANSQYFAHVLIRLFNLDQNFRTFISLAGLVICGATLLRIMWKLKTNVQLFWEIFPVFFLLLPFLVNTSWPHYFSWLPFCGIMALILSWQSRLRWLSAIALLLQSVFFFMILGDYQPYSFFGTLLFADLLILANFIFLPASEKSNTLGH